MLHYVPHMRRFNQGTVEYCTLVSMQMTQAAHGEHHDTDLAVPASVATQGVPAAALLTMFANKGYIAVDPAADKQFTAGDLEFALQRFGPLIACGRIGLGRATYGHAVVVFGVDVDYDLVLLKDPNRTIPALGNTDDLSDATVITLAAFNAVLARQSLGKHCLVGKPNGNAASLARLGTRTYVMNEFGGRAGRVMADGRSREI
ncbi:MAG TPA: papain-like cysteine protease family protein [Burkholderiaceae bacterium]